MTAPRTPAVGAPTARLEGPAKVTGTAPYAYEHPATDPLYLHPVLSTVARGRATVVHTAEAELLKGVHAVLTSANAPRLADTEDAEFAVLQSDEVAFRGQFVAAVVAETPETAREAAALVRVEYEERPHEVELDPGHQDLHTPRESDTGSPPDTRQGDVEAELARAVVLVDEVYRTPRQDNNPMEPHTTVALWETLPDRLTLYDSTQGVHTVRETMAAVFGLDPENVRVTAPHVGGGFGAKGAAKAHNVLAGLAARAVPGRTVKFALTRRHMFSLVGYRSPTVQRIRLGADAAGRLGAVVHDSTGLTSRVKEYVEQSGLCSRMMYAAPARATTHRLAALDVPIPFWMRAPGEAPGMFALETAMDELAEACGVDPVELRVRNEPGADPETGRPWSGRRLVECLREGAERFGWYERDPSPGPHRDGQWLVGTGVASAVHPRANNPGSVAEVEYGSDGRYTVSIGAVDIGTGARTALTQISAEALDCPVGRVRLRIGDSDLPGATVAGGSSGTSSWGTAVFEAVRAFRDEHGADPGPGARTRAEASHNPDLERYAMYSFGAHFAEVRVHADTGEVRVPRMLGVFSVGRVINPRTARSQLVGGMVMGLSAALHEHSVVDPRHGHVVNGDLAGYHVATNADVGGVEAHWLDETDPHLNPMGAAGVGEIGIVGMPAAIGNAARHATGLRVRELPLTPDRFLH
ncbi:xanthine dehydrogenase [Nocardiopsis terrae]|uniref:Xanthine dehydrogenase YagR molybdenum-binding subunit n=1 Tax=Nocardiopsis terrae TaxID=372655 RepID=A0ABR9HF84_9ACTN|nr:xanthine dehydrogenase family protein molybdopterin-binding subunit [Nocardiopsis terrae]MBE1457637.1 xanthine dehydrogenase YagR molybdenum-binding subunit [Nocardiopsis terrae]GHC85047.1 xanthine dehydrogenase [Nocardiopsis terrae]